MIEQQTLSKIYFALGLIGLFILYRLLNRPNKQPHNELDEVLTNDKYKVKGQHDHLKNT